MKYTRHLSITTVTILCALATACGGSDDATGVDGADPDAGDSESVVDDSDTLGGAGQWTAAELCALSTPDAVAGLHGVASVDEQLGNDETDAATCFWKDAAGSSLDLSLMRIEQRGGFTSEALGEDETLDIVGADLAGYSANVGGAASVDAVVDERWLSITFPVDTPGAREFGAVIATVWVGQQVGS